MNIHQIENTDPAFGQFLRLPQFIYRDDPHHRARPIEETRILLDEAQNPCWKHARRALFLLEREGEVIGRIAAILDSEINRQHRKSEGFFGFFECIEDLAAARELVEAASHWLVAQGCSTFMRGPCTPLPDFCNFGILIEGFDQPQVTREAINPAYYSTLLEGCGFEKDSDFFSFRNQLHNSKIFEKKMQRLKNVLRQERTSIRSFDVENFNRDAAIVNEVINSSFESENLYSKIDPDTQKFLLKNIIQLHGADWFLIAEKDGQPMGVYLSAPNEDDLLWGNTISRVRAEDFAVLPEFHRTIATTSLLYHAWDQIRRAGFKDMFISYVSEENTEMQHISKTFGCECSKRFRIYRKPL